MARIPNGSLARGGPVPFDSETKGSVPNDSETKGSVPNDSFGDDSSEVGGVGIQECSGVFHIECARELLQAGMHPLDTLGRSLGVGSRIVKALQTIMRKANVVVSSPSKGSPFILLKLCRYVVMGKLSGKNRHIIGVTASPDKRARSSCTR